MSLTVVKIVPSMSDRSQKYVVGVSKSGKVQCSCMAFRFGRGVDCKHLSKWKEDEPKWADQVAAALESEADRHAQAVASELELALSLLDGKTPVTRKKKVRQ